MEIVSKPLAGKDVQRKSLVQLAVLDALRELMVASSTDIMITPGLVQLLQERDGAQFAADQHLATVTAQAAQIKDMAACIAKQQASLVAAKKMELDALAVSGQEATIDTPRFQELARRLRTTMDDVFEIELAGMVAFINYWAKGERVRAFGSGIKACIDSRPRTEDDQSAAPAPIQSAELAELRKLAEAATPGPWAQKNKKIPYVWGTDNERGYQIHSMPIGDAAADFHPDTRATWLKDAAYIAAANPAVILRLLAAPASPAAAPKQASSEPRPSDDELWDATLRDRDTYHEWADKLAEQIAAITTTDIGEHSNMNCPWQNALDACDEYWKLGANAVQQEQAKPTDLQALTDAEISTKQGKLLALADRIDHEKLWRLAGMDHDKLTEEQKDRMNAGVALRRYADIWTPGHWVVVPPTGGIQFGASTLEKAVEMTKRHHARHLGATPAQEG
jgi:hypothetical protein